MAKKAKQKTRALDFPVPQTMTEANSFIREIGVVQRERQKLEIKMNDEVDKIKAKYESRSGHFKSFIDAHTQGLQIFCAANRVALTKDGKIKTYKFPAGEVNWRSRPPKVKLRGVAKILESLKKLKLRKFIRIKEEVNKEAMLADPKKAVAVEGVSIGSGGEDFVITPFETKLEQVA